MLPIFILAFITAAVLGLLGMIANAIIAYSVFHFKSLNTTPNIFLANWSIADCLSILSVPLLTAIYAILHLLEHHTYSCLSIQATIILHVIVLWFGILLSIDWLSAVCCIRISEKLRKCYCAVILFIWVAALFCYCLSISLCLKNVYYYVPVVIFFIFYAISQLFAIMLESYRIMTRFRINLLTYPSSIQARLIAIIVILSSYLIGVVLLVLVYLNVLSPVYNGVLIFISVLPVLCRPVIVLGILYKFDGDFRSCLLPVVIKIFNSSKIFHINIFNISSYFVVPNAKETSSA